MDNLEKAKSIIGNFRIDGELEKIKINTQGHINSTFISTFIENGKVRKYTHQMIKKSVFTHPDEVMSNIMLVTEHIQNKVKTMDEAESRCLSVVLSRDGKPYYVDSDGEYWRTYHFIDDVDTFDKMDSDKIAYELGRAIGNFQAQLSDFDSSKLYTTIKDFHNMNWRYEQLDEAVRNNKAGRLSLVSAELEFLYANKERGCRIWNGFADGSIPSRVTHNDTKLNNVLFSKKTGEGICVIDLDTIMPGTILFDTGDMIRVSCSTVTEDEKDLSKIDFSVSFYKSIFKGYLEKADYLEDIEKSLIKESGRTITQIMAVRFLTDYLNGDVYYHIAYPEHNIVRARNQIQLMKKMDEHWHEY